MTLSSTRRVAALLVLLALVATASALARMAGPQQDDRRKAPPTPGPMLADGLATFDTPAFTLVLVKSSQTVAALKPKADASFDFTPGDLLVARSQDGYYHLGDLDLRIRANGEGPWTDISTAAARTPVTTIAAQGSVLAAADLTPLLPPGSPLRVVRSWRVEAGQLALRFELTNSGQAPIEIGSLGIPMVFNNILSDRSLDEAHAKCVFFDPYIGQDAGYLQVTRLHGGGPALLVVPERGTPFEDYSPILSPPRGAARAPVFTDPTPRSVTFEGFYDWMAHSRAFAENEWKKATPWNRPTSTMLRPGESRTYGLRFLASPDIRSIETTLARAGRPVAVGIPGYVLPQDIEGRLFLAAQQPVTSLQVEPAGALTIAEAPQGAKGWKAYRVRGVSWGRSRVTVTYADGTTQTIHYRVTKPQAQVVRDLGRFLTTRQWFDEPGDLFKRSPSVMTFDRDTNAIVTQDSRVWIAGLGDEGGSSWLAGAMKQIGQPEQAELTKYQAFVDRVVWGGLQYSEGPRQYAVRKSLFFYQPDQVPPGTYRSDLDWRSWTSWNKEASEKVDRSYNYPHVAALHWSMYRAARNHVGLVTSHPWEWYLTNAYRTALAMSAHAAHYAQYGQMEGTVFLEILKDLQREGWTDRAAELEARMRERAKVWSQLSYPFGSEMPWDSTGQEEVYAWTKYFGDAAKAKVTLEAIVAYMPAVPHWGYNGSARRYWDFQYAGKIRRVERQLHHYGSGLNALPVLAEYRDRPDDFHLLRIGYAGMMAATTSIDEEGFASAAFHAFPDLLAFDPISGDYAQNFLGHALGAATYLVRHPEFGWQAFGGNLREGDSGIDVTPLDSFRTRFFVAPAGTWLTLDAGHFERVQFDPASGRIRLFLSPATADTPVARLRVERPGPGGPAVAYAPANPLELDRGAHVVPLGTGPTVVDLVRR